MDLSDKPEWQRVLIIICIVAASCLSLFVANEILRLLMEGCCWLGGRFDECVDNHCSRTDAACDYCCENWICCCLDPDAVRDDVDFAAEFHAQATYRLDRERARPLFQSSSV